jgi:phage terminase small subunit
VRQKTLEREELFASAYVAFKFNGQQAAISIGIPPGSARSMASQLLTKPHVQELVAEHVLALTKRHDLTVDAVIAEMKLIGFSNIADYTRLSEDGSRRVDFTDSTRDQLAAVANIKVKERVIAGRRHVGEDGEEHAILERETFISMHDKKGALVTLLQYLTAGKVAPENVGQTINQFNLTQNNMNITAEAAIDEYRKLVNDG